MVIQMHAKVKNHWLLWYEVIWSTKRLKELVASTGSAAECGQQVLGSFWLFHYCGLSLLTFCPQIHPLLVAIWLLYPSNHVLSLKKGRKEIKGDGKMPIGKITFTRKQSAFPENFWLSFYIALARTGSHHYP